MTRCMSPSTLVGPAWTSWVAALHRQALTHLQREAKKCTQTALTSAFLSAHLVLTVTAAHLGAEAQHLLSFLISVCSWCPRSASSVFQPPSSVQNHGFPPFCLPSWCQHQMQSNLADLQDFQSDPIPDLTKDVSSPPSGSPSWANQTINGFYFTPTLSAYPSFGTPGNNGTLALYVIDAARSSFTGGVYMAPACRFYMSVYIIPLDLPAVTSSQLFAGAASPAFSGSTTLGVTLAAACALLAFLLL